MDGTIDGVTRGTGRPWHLWAVGIGSLLWNAMGATDYLMTQTRNPAYLAMLSPAQLAWIDSFPAWSVAAWALGVWGALAGSIMLLARSRHAVTAFIVSLAGIAGTTFMQYVVNPPPPRFQTAASSAFTLVLWAVAIALLLYARRMAARGVLR